MSNLPLPWPKSQEEIVITTRTIGTECTPQRAQRVVAFLVERGWNVRYGGEGPTPKHIDDPAFTADFYTATDRILR